MPNTVLIVGAGSGLSASLARKFSARGKSVILAARNTEKLKALCDETGARSLSCDSTDPAQVDNLFEATGDGLETVIYNPSMRVHGAFETLDPEQVRQALDITAFGGFLVAQQAANRMLKSGGGTILFTGASASVKGYPKSAPFAMGKFALRGLAQSMARELAPRNIHIAHIIIDGGIASDRYPESPDQPDRWLSPDAIADNYVYLSEQPRSAWTWEIELRPWLEKF